MYRIELSSAPTWAKDTEDKKQTKNKNRARKMLKNFSVLEKCGQIVYLLMSSNFQDFSCFYYYHKPFAHSFNVASKELFKTSILRI